MRYSYASLRDRSGGLQQETPGCRAVRCDGQSGPMRQNPTPAPLLSSLKKTQSSHEACSQYKTDHYPNTVHALSFLTTRWRWDPEIVSRPQDEQQNYISKHFYAWPILMVPPWPEACLSQAQIGHSTECNAFPNHSPFSLS